MGALPGRLRSAQRPGLADAALALLLASAGLVEVSLAPAEAAGAAVVAVLFTSLPLAWRQAAPALVVATGVLGLVAAAAAGASDGLPLVAFLATGVGLYSLGEYGSNRELAVGGAIAVAAYTSVGVIERDSEHVAAGVLLAIGALTVGRAVGVMGVETDVLEARAVRSSNANATSAPGWRSPRSASASRASFTT